MPRPKTNTCQQNLFDLEVPAAAKNQEHKDRSNPMFDILDALTAPILTFSSQWMDTIPRRLLNIVQLARMKSLMKGEQTATLVECSIYIYTRICESPMDADWTDIYTHACCKTDEEWFNEDHWEEIKAPRELNEWLRSKLKDLQRHIYNQRREILKQKVKEKDLTENKTAPQKNEPDPNTQQTTLF